MKKNLTKFLLTAVLVISAQAAMAAGEKVLYAVVDGTNMTLKYGTDPGENPQFTDNSWTPNTLCAEVTTATIDKSCNSYAGTDLTTLFRNFSLLETITDIDNLRTDDVTDFSFMFSNCPKLTELNIASWNTSKVTRMLSMFTGCTSLKRLDLRSFNTSAIQNIAEMFYECSSLATIVVGEGWNCTALETTGGDNMFYNCTSLIAYDGTKYDHSKLSAAYAKIGDGGYLTATTTTLNSTIDSDNIRWSTFYHGSLTYVIDAGEDSYAYTGTVAHDEYANGHITLHKLGTGKIIPAGEGVVIVSGADNAEISMTVDNNATATVTGTNNIHGIDTRTRLDIVKETFMHGWTNKFLHVMGMKTEDDKNVVRFRRYYKYQGSDTELYVPAHKGFVCTDFYNNKINSLDLPMTFEGEVTGIEEIQGDKVQGDDCWNTINGMRLQGKPSFPGIYIYNGKKTIIE